MRRITRWRGPTVLRGGGGARAVAGVEAVVRAACQGRVEALLLAEGGAAWGRYDPTADVVETAGGLLDHGEDLLDAAAVRTLRQGGEVHVLPREDVPGDEPAAAVLRF